MTLGVTGQTQVQQPRVSGGEGATSGMGTQKTGSGTQGQSGPVPEAKAEATAQTSQTTLQVEKQVLKEAEAFFKEAESALSEDGDTALERIQNLLSGIRSDSILGALLIQFASMARDQALDDRLNARDQAQTELKTAAKEVADAAQKAFNSAVTMAVVGIVAAAASFAASGASGFELKGMTKGVKDLDSLKGLAKNADEMADAMDAVGDTARSKTFRDMADEWRTDAAAVDVKMKQQHMKAEIGHEIGQVTNQGAQSGAKMGTAQEDREAALDEQDKLEAQARASLAESEVELDAGLQTELLEMIRATLEFIKSQNQAEADLMASMTRVAG